MMMLSMSLITSCYVYTITIEFIQFISYNSSVWRLTMMFKARICAILPLLLFSLTKANADQNRLVLVDQSDFGLHKGFYIDIENTPAPNSPCVPAGIHLYLGVANGTEWHFLMATPNWEMNHQYHIKAVINPNGAKLWIDRQLMAKYAGSFMPNTGDLTAFDRPGWAAAPATYIPVEGALQLTETSNTGKLIGSLHKTFLAARNSAILLFNPDYKKTYSWITKPDSTVTINTTLELITPPTVASISPVIDKYGQLRQASWPRKILSDSQLLASVQREAIEMKSLPPVPHRDPFGGDTNLGWHSAGTGNFRLLKNNGKWWLITPDGNPCFYTGVCSAPQLNFDATDVTKRSEMFGDLPPTSGKFSDAWQDGNNAYNFNISNMIRKFGSDWQQKGTAETVNRLKHFGFDGAGKWSSEIKGVPYCPVLGYGNTPLLVKHPDIFNPTARRDLAAVLRSQITPHLNDPDVVGWSFGNEISEIIMTSQISDILNMGADVDAKQALVKYALKHIYQGDIATMAASWKVDAASEDEMYAAKPSPPPADVEVLRQYYATTFYRFLYQTIKGIDPNHLYFGFWIVPGWWQNASDWKLIAPWCDAIGYDRYSYKFAGSMFDPLIRSTNKPIFCGEFSFPPTYKDRGFGRYGTHGDTPQQSGTDYARYVMDAARSPYCVGTLWFEYRDEPLTGRDLIQGPDLIYGEHYAFGIVDVTDRPRWPLVKEMRAVNSKLDRIRQQESDR